MCDPWMSAMRRGDFAAAWAISDRALAQRHACREACTDWPRHLQFVWDGSSFDDRHVLVRCYHGLGDTLQYVRLIEPLRQRAREVTLWAQPALLGLLEHVRGIDRLLALHDGVPEIAYDVDMELMELPHALRIDAADLPGRIPYLALAAPEPRSPPSTALRVGLAWRSGAWNAQRSIAPTELLPLSGVSGLAMHSLQYPCEPLAFPARELAARDILEMARRMMSLDLVISVDTMIAHLAGALGLPTWLLLHEHADWRWGEDCDRSLWYPTMRLFRRRTHAWAPLIEAVRAALERAAAQHAAIATPRTRSGGCRAS